MFNTIQSLPVVDASQFRRSIVLSITEGVLTALPYGLFLYVVQLLMSEAVLMDIVWVAIAIFIILSARVLATREAVLHTGFMTSVACAGLRERLAGHFMKVPMGFFQQHDAGRLGNSMNRDVELAEGIFSRLFSMLFSTVALLLTVSFILFIYDWRLALALLAGVPLAALVQWRVQRYANRISGRWMEQVSDTNGAIMDWVQGLREHRLAGNGERQLAGLRERIEKTQRLSLQHEARVGLVPVIFMLLSESGFAFFLLVGVHLYFSGDVELAVFLTFLIAAARIYRGLSQIAMTIAESRFMEQAALRLLQLLRSETLNSGNAVINGSAEVKVVDVSFSYPRMNAVAAEQDDLKGINFSARPGTLTAIVGPSGSGKTTLINLLARFWVPGNGQILFDDQDIMAFDDQSLYQHLALVSQHTFLMDDSILSNLLMARPGITEADVIVACQKACCHNFIEQLPQGYNTQIGEMGGALSGGERQRLSLARALLVDAKVILLDEISSALDVENEHNILKMLHKLKRGRTLIMIAHQETMVEGADQVLFLQNGRQSGCANHQKLLSESADYRKHWLKS
ncbi:MAG: hypothetical protein OFPII_03760 [Osedax symbiont Rs1]|nr:MAG: hypothetical protein OFPII_03760 [Osedax symbiont Rs1]